MTDAAPPEVDVEVASITPSTARLAAALSKFQGVMPTVTKNKTATIPGKEGRSGYSYNYADLADVTAAAMPLLSVNGLSFVTIPEEGSRGFILRGVLLHESGESIEGFLPLHGNSNQDMGSSLTYLRRYLLGALTGIVTDEDDDGTAGNTAGRTTKSQPRQRQAKAPAGPATPPAEQGPPLAADPAWADKIKTADTFDELTAVYNEADRLGVLGQMLGEETLKSRLYARRTELTAKDAQ